MYPAPPVTRTLRAIRPLQAEQLLQRLEEAVTAPGLRGLLERNRGGVQKLVEQRVAELLHLGPILGRQVRKALEGTLQLRGAHVVEAPAKLFQHRHHSQPAVPGPEPLDLIAHDAFGRGQILMSLCRSVRGDRLQVVDVVQKHVLELSHCGLHVPRHREVEDAERSPTAPPDRSEEHTSELQSRENLVCRLLLEKKNRKKRQQEA